MTPMGTFSQKIQCQPSVWVMSPPTIGPDATASPPMPPQMPTMVPRFSGGKAVVRMVRLKGMTMAAPMPCTTRAAMSCSRVADSAHATEAAGENKKPMAQMGRRAKRSPHAGKGRAPAVDQEVCPDHVRRIVRRKVNRQLRDFQRLGQPLAWIVGSEDGLYRLALLFAWDATEHRRVRRA